MVGRPPKYKTPEEMQVKIDAYFVSCEGELLRDAEGTPMLDKYSQPICIGRRPPTVCGLARALGFSSRQSLLNYKNRKPEFVGTITCAKLRIEEFNEESLYYRESVNGAKFNLMNNFAGWKERQEITTTGEPVKIVDDIPRGDGNV